MAKQEPLTLEQIRAWQDLLLPALELVDSEQKLAEQIGLNQSTISDLKRGPRIGMTFITTVKLFAQLGISPDKVAETLGLWRGDEKGIEPEIYARVAALNETSKEKREKILWVLDALLKE